MTLLRLTHARCPRHAHPAQAGLAPGRGAGRTLTEIKECALEQVAAGGPDAVSLNAVARAMRMSGPALYRYFSSRDELLAVLVAESYEHLADHLAAAANGATGQPARERFRMVSAAYRSWALDQPHRYRLTFMSTAGSGRLEPQRIVPAAHPPRTTPSAARPQLRLHERTARTTPARRRARAAALPGAVGSVSAAPVGACSDGGQRVAGDARCPGVVDWQVCDEQPEEQWSRNSMCHGVYVRVCR